MSGGHTPGPWVVEDNDAAYVKEGGLATLRIEERSTCSEMVLALIVTDVKPLQDAAPANARLIAAAPDLLTELERTADWINRNVPAGTYAATTRLTAIRAAIAKASTPPTGEA